MTAALAVAGAAAAAWLLARGRRNTLLTRLDPRGSRGHRRAGPWHLQRRARAAEHRHAEVATACLVLGGELGSGTPPGAALGVVAAEWPGLFGDAAAAAAVGGDVAAALRAGAETPGCSALAAVAAGWEVTERTGAPLARTLTAVADALRAEAAVRREAQTQLATARTTARLLAALPVATTLLLSGPDGAAVRFLLTTPFGWACLLGAAALAGAGLWWVDRLARTATRSAWTV